MTIQLKLLDHIQLNSRLYTNFACDYSEDGKIFILSESGVCVLTLKGYPEHEFPRMCFKKDLCKLSDLSIVDHLDIDISEFINDLSRENLYEAVLDVALSGNDLSTTELNSKPIYAMWSPRGVVEKTDGVLAVLTNLHNIEIYVEVLDENELTTYTCIGNFAKDISDQCKRTWNKIDSISNNDEKFYELKKRIDYIAPTTFTWSHVVLKDKKACCVLFVGHRDGSISAWRFVERKISNVYDTKLEFLTRYNTNVGKITSLHWFCRKSDAGGLSIGDVDGRISAVSVSKLSTSDIIFSDEVTLNEETDLKVDKLTIMTHLNITYLIGVKQNYLCVYAINDYGEVLQGKLIQAGNLYISGVVHYEKNVLLVLSVCGLLKQVQLSVVDKEINFTESVIHLNIDTNRYRTHGIVFSPNKVFLGVLSYPCRLKDVSRGKNFVNFFIFSNLNRDPSKTLMDIQVQNMRDYWDCLETLRVKSIQEKVFPWQGIDPNLNYDELPLVKLKILRWISKMSEKIFPIVPRVMEYNIKPYVLLNYAVDIKLAVERMTLLLNTYFNERNLTLFQMRSLDLLNFFLKEMVLKDVLTKANLGETFIDEIYGVMKIANEIEYPAMPQCLWCGEKIIGSSCVPYHIDSRCAISLMPIIITPGYKCPFCKCVVNREIDREFYPIFCPYCDIPMKKKCFDKRLKKDESTDTTHIDDVVTSDCKEDCLNGGDVHFDDEDSLNFIVLSDSDDDTEEKNGIFDEIRKITTTTEGLKIEETFDSNEQVEDTSDKSILAEADEDIYTEIERESSEED